MGDPVVGAYWGVHEGFDLEALAREELTEAEVRSLLERLGREEFGSDSPTVGAVAEATGESVQSIGARLAELRGDEFRARFESILNQHESRISRLEQGKHPMSNAQIKDYSHDAANFRLKPEEGKTSPLQLGLGILAGIAAVVIVWLFLR